MVALDLQRKKKLDKERRQDLEEMLVDETRQPIKIVDPDEEEELLMTLDAMIRNGTNERECIGERMI